MAKRKDPLLIALANGESFTWTVPEGGDLASMRAAIKHGQTLTMSPVRDPSEVQVGDLVLVRWHGGHIYHLVGEIADGKFLITNSVGKINGWVAGDAIIGRVTKTVDPEPRPSLSDMLTQMGNHYADIVAQQPAGLAADQRFKAIVDDLRWYAQRLGAEQTDRMPRSNKWSLEQHVWRLLRLTQQGIAEGKSVDYFIDIGKKCVGAAAEIMLLLTAPAPATPSPND